MTYLKKFYEIHKISKMRNSNKSAFSRFVKFARAHAFVSFTFVYARVTFFARGKLYSMLQFEHMIRVEKQLMDFFEDNMYLVVVVHVSLEKI